MTMEFVPGTTSITFGGVDITPMVDTSKPIAMRFERVTEENFLDGWAKPIRITLRGRSDRLSPLAYRLLLGRTHPRIQRIHTAYSRRRGRGRW
jgi:hypothetical protein